MEDCLVSVQCESDSLLDGWMDRSTTHCDSDLIGIGVTAAKLGGWMWAGLHKVWIGAITCVVVQITVK